MLGHLFCTSFFDLIYTFSADKVSIMVIGSTMHYILILQSPLLLNHCPSTCPLSSLQNPKQAVRAQAETKKHEKIPDVLISLESCQRSHPFSFLFFSSSSHNPRVQIIDAILQSLTPLRPHSKLWRVYSSLLSCTLQSSHPLSCSCYSAMDSTFWLNYSSSNPYTLYSACCI